jgi:hypothetical protein
MDAAKSTHDDICCRNGPAVCARYKLALEHDMRIASESAKFDTRFLKLGLYLGGGDTRKLLRTVNWSQALLLLLPGQSIEARGPSSEIGRIRDARKQFNTAISPHASKICGRFA